MDSKSRRKDKRMREKVFRELLGKEMPTFQKEFDLMHTALHTILSTIAISEESNDNKEIKKIALKGLGY